MADNNSQIDYPAVLADLKAKRAALDSAISAIEQIVSSLPTSVAATGGRVAPSNGAPAQIESDTFFHMTVPDAAKKFLSMVKKPQSTPEIAAALEKGGFTHQSANFINTVGAVLHRSSAGAGSEIVKVSRGRYGLASWYGPKRSGSEQKSRDDSDTDSSS